MNFWTLRKGPIGCPEKSVINYPYFCEITPAESSSHSPGGGIFTVETALRIRNFCAYNRAGYPLHNELPSRKNKITKACTCQIFNVHRNTHMCWGYLFNSPQFHNVSNCIKLLVSDYYPRFCKELLLSMSWNTCCWNVNSVLYSLLTVGLWRI
jgi:hypothetical protein